MPLTIVAICLPLASRQLQRLSLECAQIDILIFEKSGAIPTKPEGSGVVASTFQRTKTDDINPGLTLSEGLNTKRCPYYRA